MSDYWQRQRYDDAHFALTGLLPGQKPARILVTGSRAFADANLVAAALREVLGERGLDPAHVVLVHGGAYGADRIAASVGKRMGMTPEAHPADWSGPCRVTCLHGPRKRRRDGSEYCPAAGDYRNQLMIDLGADFMLAFLVPKKISPCNGTWDAIRRARAAGITTRIHESGGVA